MGIAGHTPNFTAAGTILPFSCVKAGTTDPFRVQVATLEDEVVLGVTDGSTRAFDSTNHAVAGDPVVLQNSEFVQLRAGGTIAVGDGLRPTTNGAVIVASDRVQFVACDSAVSGEIFWAQRVGSVELEIPSPAFYGSNRAGSFLQDAINGTDSLDIVVIGDSNAGFPGDNGYTVAWNRVMQFGLRVPVYATPLMSGGPSNQRDLTTGNIRGDGLWCLGNSQQWNAEGEAGGTYTGTTFKNMIQSTDSEIVGLRTWLGFNFTDYNVNSTANKSIFPLGWMSNPAVVEVGQRFTSNFINYIGISNQLVSSFNAFGSELGFGTAGTGGHALQYRIVYGTFPTAGSFKPYAFYLGTTGALLRDSSTTSTGGGYGYRTKPFDVTSFTLAAVGSQPSRVCFTWDGADSATNADQANGPFACLWQSVIRPNFKGYSVSCLNYFGGLTTTQVAEKIEDCDKMLDAYLKELRERQVGTTPGTAGTGRVLVFLNSGINGTETTSTWPLAAQRIIDRFRARWVATGGTLSNLAFVFTVTHPTTDSGVTWTANRAAVAAAANAYAVANGSTYNLAVVDIGQMMTGLVMSRYSMYDSGGQAHLTKVAIPPAAVTTATDGYQTITSAIVSALTSST